MTGLSPPPTRAGTATAADGTALAWRAAGDPSSPSVLLLPGQANSSAWWSPRLENPLSAVLHTITFDPRGTGGSRDAAITPEAPWTTASFADDAAVVLDAAGVDRAHVYGTSMGGRVAQQLAVRHPQRVARLVLACTSPGGPLAVERDSEVRRRLADPDATRRTAALVDLFYTPAAAHTLGASSSLFGDPSMSPAAQRAHLRASNSHDTWDLLPTIEAATLILHGTDDRMVPVDNAHLLAARLPDAGVELFDGGRHGFFDEFASSVTGTVLDWLCS